MDKLKELEAEIQRIKKEVADKKKAEYQYLVGKYVHRSHTSYEKIMSIDRVMTDEDGDEVIFTSVKVYFDNRGDEYNSDANIELQNWGQAYADDLNRQMISVEDFNKSFDACVDLIRRKIK